MERVGETDQYFRVDVAGLPAGRPPAVALAASGYPALVEANLPRLVGAFVTPAVTWPSSAANAWGRRGRCLSPEGMTDLPGQRPRHGAGMRAARRGGHHPQPVPGRVLDQDGHDVPGRVRVEMPVCVPHHLRNQRGVQVGELTRKTLRYMINRAAFGIGGHHLQGAGVRWARSIGQTDAPPRRVGGIRARSDTRAIPCG